MQQKPCTLKLFSIEKSSAYVLHFARLAKRKINAFRTDRSDEKIKKVELYRFEFIDRSPYNENAHFCSWTSKIMQLDSTAKAHDRWDYSTVRTIAFSMRQSNQQRETQSERERKRMRARARGILESSKKE